MSKLKILATADIHFERLDEERIIDYTNYFIKALRKHKPQLFVLAGDTTDNRGLRAESDKYQTLVDFISTISKVCDDIGTIFTVLEGTPSHEGEIVKKIIDIKELNIKYYGQLEKVFFKGFSILYMPEMYCPSLKIFNELVDKATGGDKVDLCIFHGMFDFAIPALKQVDSSFNQSRTVVIDEENFENTFISNLAIGGHVHKAFKKGNVYYLGRFVNEAKQAPDSDKFGLKLVTLDEDGTHDIEVIPNPYLSNYDFLTIVINKETTIEEIMDEIHETGFEKDNIIFTMVIDNDKESKGTYRGWREVYKPRQDHIRQRFVTKKNDVALPDLSRKVSNNQLSEEDLDDLIKTLYKEMTNNTLGDDILETLKAKKGDE